MDSKSYRSILIKCLLFQCLFVLCAAQDFDFFYFVQQWPGSYCDTKMGCCYPTTGKPPPDFSIHGLWPTYSDGSYPSNCDPDSIFDKSQISDLISKLQQDWPSLSCTSINGLKLWSYEWAKYGTCSESELDQHAYFSAALSLKSKLGLLQILASAGINPDGGFYNLSSVQSTIKNAIGYIPYIRCNVDENRNSQLYQIYVCVDTSGSNFIECPVFPNSSCPSRIEFPSFGAAEAEDVYWTAIDRNKKNVKLQIA